MSFLCPPVLTCDLQIQPRWRTYGGKGSVCADAGQQLGEPGESKGLAGWNAETRGYVNTLVGEDWHERYGIAVEGVVVRNPLTSLEIDLI